MLADVLHQVLVADSETQQEASWEGFGDGALGVGRRHRVSGVDVGDAGGDPDGGGTPKQQRGYHERVAPDRLGEPDRSVAQVLQFGGEFNGPR